jgi:hypothetical protein
LRGVRAFVRNPIDIEQARRQIRERLAAREARFLELLDASVWPVPASPYRKLLDNAGLDAGSVGELVHAGGLDAALHVLRDAGVYIAYEEFLGNATTRRGSSSFDFQPEDFFNPLVRADYFATSGATRSKGVMAPGSFAFLAVRATNMAVILDMWAANDAPRALWYPALPSGAGINQTLLWARTGAPPDRWFSQISRAERNVPFRKQLLNVVLPMTTLGTGTRLPRPRLTRSPDAVFAWCLDALRTHDQGVIATYPTSAVQLAELALDQGARLDGLRVLLGGEPVTSAKQALIEAAGGRAVNFYGFAQVGMAGAACAACGADEVHAMTHDLPVIHRRRARVDGVAVDAFCWTNLVASSAIVAINLENDDYGEIVTDGSCDCQLTRLGLHPRLRGMRGMSKVVTGGTTLPGEMLETLVEVTLPSGFGGSGVHYQFVEQETGGSSRLVLRIDPALGDVDEAAVVATLRDQLRASEPGVLADGVWAEGGLSVERVSPTRARSGKILPFETLRAD